MTGAVALIVSAFLCAVYTLTVSARAFFPAGGSISGETAGIREAGARMLLPVGLFTLVDVALGVWPGPIMELIGRIGYEGSISEATVYVNIATVYNAFSENDRSIAMFEKARSIYESIPELRPELLGGLYNNMALTYVALKQFPKAYELYDKAMETMKKVENGELEQAISYLNIANAKEDELGLEEAGEDIESCLDKAYALLDTPSVPRGGYYAFVCEKCAPTFDYYGYFVAAEELKKRAKEIYERA